MKNMLRPMTHMFTLLKFFKKKKLLREKNKEN